MKTILGVLLFIVHIYALADTIYLTPSQKKWLSSHQNNLKVGITEIPNQVLFDAQNKPYGFAIDFYKEIEKLLHIQFRFIPYKDWDALMHAAKQREVDIVFLAQKIEARLPYFDFTDTVLIQQNKIIANSMQKKIQTTQDLVGKKVAVVAQSAVMDYLQNSYKKLTLIPTHSELESLEFVSQNRADATIAESVRAGYYIKQNKLDNLYVAARFDLDYRLRIASRSDSPMLNVILNKAVESVPAVKKEELYLKWGYIKDEVNYFDKETLTYIAIFFGVVIPFSIYLFFINRRLKREIAQKIDAQTSLSNLNQHLQERIDSEVEKNKRQQLLLLQQNRLSQLGEMISMIAHQWRQPLNILSMIIQYANLQFKKGTLDEAAMEDFQTKAKAQITQMTQTIDDFKDFFKPDKKSTLTDIGDVIDHALEIVKPIYQKHAITISFETDTYNIEIQTYPNELGQVIINILNNAKDALINNDVASKQIFIRLQKHQESITIEIEDNAGGISEDIIGKIFDPYFSTKESKGGTGLGLYMSKMIIEEHCRGDLSVQNSHNGALFTITLYKQQPEA